jgi:hypothetical protein
VHRSVRPPSAHLQQASDCIFELFDFFGPRVSRVSQFSTELSELGFLQLIEGALQLTNVLLSFKAYCWQS